MAGGKFIKHDYQKNSKLSKLTDCLDLLVFNFTIEYQYRPDIIILGIDVYVAYRDYCSSRMLINPDNEIMFQGIIVIDSYSLNKKEIQIY